MGSPKVKLVVDIIPEREDLVFFNKKVTGIPAELWYTETVVGSRELLYAKSILSWIVKVIELLRDELTIVFCGTCKQ